MIEEHVYAYFRPTVKTVGLFFVDSEKRRVLMKITNTNTSILHMTQLGMLGAISIVLVALIRIPIVPAVPFLVYDMADAPIIIASLLFGTVPSLLILFIVSVIQAFLFGGNG
jgi:riboflavin transporter FmnP